MSPAWIWAGLGTCFDQWNAAKVMLCDLGASISKGFSTSSHICSEHCCPVNKSSLAPWKMRHLMKRGRARQPCHPTIPAVPAEAPDMGVSSSGTSNPSATHQWTTGHMREPRGVYQRTASLSTGQTANPKNCDQINVCRYKPWHFRLCDNRSPKWPSKGTYLWPIPKKI